MKRQTAILIRKSHRYLGVFLGLQFLMWTLSGLYFSWTNIDEIHGDNFKILPPTSQSFDSLISPTALQNQNPIQTISLKEISGKPYYWINKKQLYNAQTGELKKGISEAEALSVAKRYVKKTMLVKDIQLIKETGKHHEYRGGLLPAYVISYQNDGAIKVYISIKDGAFKTLRHRSWRWFDFLWMTHTMDYQERDNINTLTLRLFSLLGLITVLSGFLLWFTSSPSVRKVKKKIL